MLMNSAVIKINIFKQDFLLLRDKHIIKYLWNYGELHYADSI